MMNTDDDLNAQYCRLLGFTKRRVELTIEATNVLIKHFPLKDGEIAGRLTDELFESRDNLVIYRDEVRKLEELFCDLDDH